MCFLPPFGYLNCFFFFCCCSSPSSRYVCGDFITLLTKHTLCFYFRPWNSLCIYFRGSVAGQGIKKKIFTMYLFFYVLANLLGFSCGKFRRQDNVKRARKMDIHRNQFWYKTVKVVLRLYDLVMNWRLVEHVTLRLPNDSCNRLQLMMKQV